MKNSHRRSHDPEDHLAELRTPNGPHYDWESWTYNDVQAFLQSKGFPKEADIFKNEEINGRLLPRITEERLEKWGIGPAGQRMRLMEVIDISIRNSSLEFKTKVFNDPVHGHIDFHPLLIKIIDTPQFQRLRFIKQLGCSYFVFPGAAHNRFEHSLGVAFLAGELVNTLRRKQPELGITSKDVLCVQIAGLCHDLGHGPFSHMFDMYFIPRVRPDFKWKHERLSVLMFEHLIKENGLKGELEKYGLDEEDISFIKEQIEGPPKESWYKKDGQWLYKGRGRDKSFLYEVVANKRNGIDVDKWDYFARDCHNLGIANSFDHWRCMSFARVLEVEGQKQICSRDKEAGNLYDMFHTRKKLHRQAYQHKVNKIMEMMVVEALIKADPHLRIFPGKNGKKLTMSESLTDMHAFTKLTDNVLEHIDLSEDPALKPAQEILEKVFKRQLYKCVGQSQLPKGMEIVPEIEISKEVCLALSEKDLEGPQLDPDDLIVNNVTLDYGMGEQNPMDHVRFYSKESPSKAVIIRKGQVSQTLPDRFRDRYIRLFSKQRDAESVRKAVRCFEAWCDKKEVAHPNTGNMLDIEMTPDKRPRDGEDHQDGRTNTRRSLDQEFSPAPKARRF